MQAELRTMLERLRAKSSRSGIFLDFDGTLSEIAPRPELARPVPGALEILARLAAQYAVVAVVSGRPAGEIRGLVPARAIEAIGLYGLERDDHGEAVAVSAVPDEVRAEVRAVAESVEGAWVEDKGRSLAVHYRAAPDRPDAIHRLSRDLGEVAFRHGLRLLPGKMVVELAPAQTPGKGTVVAGEVRARGLAGCLYAGDDLSDLDAFAALDRLRGAGLLAVKVAVRSEETPEEVVSAADVAVERPAGLVALLNDLA